MFLSIRPAASRIGPQGRERPDRRGGPPFGPGLEALAQQDERDHHSRRFEIQMRFMAGMSPPPQPHRECPGGCRTHCDQQLHVARAGAQGMPARFVKACPQDELNGSGECKLHPGRQHPVQARRDQQHGQHEWRGQEQGQRSRPVLAMTFGSCGGVETLHAGRGGLRRGFADGISRTFDRLTQRVDRKGGAAHAGPLGGQIDAGMSDPGNLQQGAFDPGYTRGTGHAFNGQIDPVMALIGRASGFDRNGVSGRHDPSVLLAASPPSLCLSS